MLEWQLLIHHLPASLSTPHHLLAVSTRPVVTRVEPLLSAIVDQVIEAGMTRAISLCSKVLEDIKQRIEVYYIYMHLLALPLIA